jgi:hypothetical protein
MSERPRFKPPNNLFLLNPKHEANLHGQVIRFHDGQFLELLIVIIVVGAFFGALLVGMIARFAEKPFDPTSITSVIAMAFIAFILVLMLGIGIRHLRRNRKLERDGHLLVGQIVKAEGKPQRSGYRVEIQYRFTSTDGNALEGRDERSRNDLDDQSLPAVDTPVAVLYVNPALYRVL